MGTGEKESSINNSGDGIRTTVATSMYTAVTAERGDQIIGAEYERVVAGVLEAQTPRLSGANGRADDNNIDTVHCQVKKLKDRLLKRAPSEHRDSGDVVHSTSLGLSRRDQPTMKPVRKCCFRITFLTSVGWQRASSPARSCIAPVKSNFAPSVFDTIFECWGILSLSSWISRKIINVVRAVPNFLSSVWTLCME